MLIALLEVGILEVKYMKMKLCALLAAIGLCAGTLSGCGGKTPAAADTSAAGKSSVGELADVELAEGELAQEELAKAELVEGKYDAAPSAKKYPKPGVRQPRGCGERRNGAGYGGCAEGWGL